MRSAPRILAVLLGIVAIVVIIWQIGLLPTPAGDAASAPVESADAPVTPPIANSPDTTAISSKVGAGVREAVEVVRYAVRGRVIDTASHKALPGVQLRLAAKDPEETLALEYATDVSGAFLFEELEPLTYILKTRPTEQLEYACKPLELDLAAQPTHVVEVNVEKRWFLAGIVVEAGTLLPVADVALTARGAARKRVRLGRTDREGRFRATRGCAAGVWHIHQSSGTDGLERVRGDGPELARVQVGAIDATHLRIELPWNGRLRGVVTDLSGRPIEDAEVRALGADQLSLRSPEQRFWALYKSMASNGVVDYTDAFGRFELSRLPNDRDLVVVTSAKGYVTAPCQALHPPFPRDGEEMRIRLSEGGAIHGQVLDADGGPLKEAHVVATSKEVEYQPDPTRGDETGRFELEGIAPGQYLVAARIRNREMRTRTVASRTVTVAAGETTEILLQKGASSRSRVAGTHGDGSDPQGGGSDGTRIAGRVVDEDGHPVTSEREPGLKIRYRTMNPVPGVLNLHEEVPAEADGSFVIYGLEPGPHELYVLTYVAGDPYSPVTVNAPAEDVILKWTPSRKILIKLKILDALSGQPIQSGSVALKSPESGTLGGNFFGGSQQYMARQGLFEAFASARGHAPEVQSLDLRGYTAEECVVEFRLREGRRVTGVVQDAAGEPVKGAALVPILNDHWTSESVVYSGADGRFETDSAPWTGGQIGLLSKKWRRLAQADITGSEVVLVLPAGADG